jgi:transcriptional regulator with XRE-family HTH domain
MLINKCFDETLKKYGITGATLSRKTGITASHISQFRNGKGGAVSHTTLEQMLQAMEELAPGSKIYFCQLLAGISSVEFLVNSDRSDLRSLIVKANLAEQVEALRLIAEILAKNIRNNPDIVELAEAV